MVVFVEIVLFDFIFLSSVHWNDEDLVRSCYDDAQNFGTVVKI